MFVVKRENIVGIMQQILSEVSLPLSNGCL